MALIGQVTVYADVRDANVLRRLTELVTTLCGSATIHTIPDADTDDPLAFLHLWEKEKLDVYSFVKNNVPIMLRFECFVTDSKNRDSGVVAYALYHRQMPVLSLADVEGVREKEDKGDDWIAAALYCTMSSLGCTSSADALTAFFSFPEVRGKVIALEGNCASFVKGQSQLLRDHILHKCNLPVELVGVNGCDVSSTDGEEVMNGLYASFIDDLLNNPLFLTIREESPQLHGALCALNRHHHLPILRYRLQRGINIIMCCPLSSVLGELAHDFVSQKKTTEDVRESLVQTINSIMQFELRWLGLPKADLVLVCRGGDSSAASPTRWAEFLWSEGRAPSFEAFSNWHEVVVDSTGSGEGALHGGVLAAVQHLLVQ